ncbi:hypothetical protein LR48_Vigan07g229600 [Vigna angularis]|uniref:peroxidase n=1 Tax=Phaseolus angularis TaxID=3914 RepID=A0A0L9V164_PHAAN|nr:hypothetical protein LR48_Vigan07g229600 [Vigna angularis]
MPMSQITEIFTRRGFSVEEFVALSGAHTVGFSHYSEFITNLPNSSSSYNPRFYEPLSKACAGYRTNPTLSVFNDIIQNLPKGLGVLKSDHGLYNDPVTRPFLEGFAKDQARFFRVFALTMQKLILLNVHIGEMGRSDAGVIRLIDSFFFLEVVDDLMKQDFLI